MLSKVIKLTSSQITDSFLLDFNRYQETTVALRLIGSALVPVKDNFTDSWSSEDKIEIAQRLNILAHKSGIVLAIMEDNRPIAFASLQDKLVGPNSEYLELNYLHVDTNCRGRGFGSLLFDRCKKEALLKGASKLFIVTHPAQATQAFYKSMGCVTTDVQIDYTTSHHSLDLNLELSLL